jgi:hypothetical protein
MNQTGLVKVTLDIFGVSVKAEFMRTEDNYRANISKNKAVKCYASVVNLLAQNNVPKDMTITVTTNSWCYNTYSVMLMRFWEKNNSILDDNNLDCLAVSIIAEFDGGVITASHNLFDWLQAQKIDTKHKKQQIDKERLLLTTVDSE